MIKLISLLAVAAVSFAGSAYSPVTFQIPNTVQVPIGAVMPYAGITLPAGGQFAWADGECISKNSYPAAWLVLGNQHGYCGDTGSFPKPDLRGRFIRGSTPAEVINVGNGSNDVPTTSGLRIGNNPFYTGMRVRLVSGTVAGLSAGVDYYVSADKLNYSEYINFATSRANAHSGAVITLGSSAPSNPKFSSFEDPDFANRERAALFGPSTGIGSFEGESIGSHSHSITGSSGSGSGTTLLTSSTAPGSTQYTGNTGGAENRPANIALGYIIRVK